MHVSSRHMPPRPDHSVGWLITTFFFGLVLLFFALPGLLWWPFAVIGPGIAIMVTAHAWRRDKRIANARTNESICEFARSYDRRIMNPWIVRAVYEEFSDRYPIRSADRFVEDLHIDDEDFLWGVLAIIERVGLHLDEEKPDPLFENITTVEDLVLALHTLPKSPMSS